VELGVNAASKLANWEEVHMYASQRANHKIRTFSLRLNKTPRVELSVNAASKLANWGGAYACLTASQPQNKNIFLAA